VATAWLVVVSLLVGPMGLGVGVASAKTCGSSCPCDDAPATPCDDAHAEEDGHDAHDDDHGDGGEPGHREEGPVDEDCPDECPDNCPDCSCCSGVVMAVVPVTMPRGLVSFDSLTVPASLSAAPPGASFHVYRPPR